MAKVNPTIKAGLSNTKKLMSAMRKGIKAIDASAIKLAKNICAVS